MDPAENKATEKPRMMTLFKWCGWQGAKNFSPAVDTPYVGTCLSSRHWATEVRDAPPFHSTVHQPPSRPSMGHSFSSTRGPDWHQPNRAARCLDVRRSRALPNSLQEGSANDFPVPQKPSQHHGFQAVQSPVPVLCISKLAADATSLQSRFWGTRLLPCRHNKALVYAPWRSQVPSLQSLRPSVFKLASERETLLKLRSLSFNPSFQVKSWV